MAPQRKPDNKRRSLGGLHCCCRIYFSKTINAGSLWLSWWGAAALSALAFGLLHTYQGRNGVIGVALVGIIMTLLVAATRSLFLVMMLHTLIDAGNGLVIWIALREEPQDLKDLGLEA